MKRTLVSFHCSWIIWNLWVSVMGNRTCTVNWLFLLSFSLLWTNHTFMQPPKFDFNDPKTPFFTSPRFLPPTKMEKCRVCFSYWSLFYLVCDSYILLANWFLQIVDAIISHGCFLNECNILHSIVGVRSRLETGVELEVSYIFVEKLLLWQFGAYKIKRFLN